MAEDLAAALLGEIDDEVRLDVLRRLAEQAMTDLAFRAVARDDLEGALELYGYDLNEKEMELVRRFRTALAEAGIDLFLTEQLDVKSRQLFGELITRS